MSQTHQDIFALLEAFGAEVPGLSKQASIGDNTPDHTKPVSNGERSAENSSDVKKNVANTVVWAKNNGKEGRYRFQCEQQRSKYCRRCSPPCIQEYLIKVTETFPKDYTFSNMRKIKKFVERRRLEYI